MKIPGKLKPILSSLIGITSIILAYEILNTSFYDGQNNANSFEYHLALADLYTKQIQRIVSRPANWQISDGEEELVFRRGDKILGLAQNALQAYHKAIELNPAHGRSHLLLAWYYGTTLNNLSDFGFRLPASGFLSPQHSSLSTVVPSPQSSVLSTVVLAKAEFELAIKLDPSSADIHKAYGAWAFDQVAKDRTWLEVAVREYRQAAESDPTLVKEALTHYLKYVWNFERLMEILPDDYPDPMPTVANFLYDNGSWELNEPEFMAKMNQLTEKYKKNKQKNNYDEEDAEELLAYYKTLASIYQKKNQSSQAVTILEDYLELEPKQTEAHFWLANYSFNSRPWTFTKAHYQKALESGTDGALYRARYGYHLCQKLEFEEAIRQLRTSLRLQPKGNSARNWLEDCYRKMDAYGLSEPQFPEPLSSRTE